MNPSEWDALPIALRRRIEITMLACFCVGFVGGFIGCLLAEVLK